MNVPPCETVKACLDYQNLQSPAFSTHSSISFFHIDHLIISTGSLQLGTKKTRVSVPWRSSKLKLVENVALPDERTMLSYLCGLIILWNIKHFYCSPHKPANLYSDVICYLHLTWAILLHSNYQCLTIYLFVYCFSKVLLKE